MDKGKNKPRPAATTGPVGLLSTTASSTHNKRFVGASATTTASSFATASLPLSSSSGLPSSSSASTSSQSILTSMRRHLPKATHGHLDTLSEWSRFRTAKRFEREQQQHLYGRMSGASSSATNGASVFRVQVPAKLVLIALAVFLVIPVTIFGWKETHWKDEDSIHHVHVRGGTRSGASPSSRSDPHWMEHNLYKKDAARPETQAEQQSPQPPPPPASGDGGADQGGSGLSDVERPAGSAPSADAANNSTSTSSSMTGGSSTAAAAVPTPGEESAAAAATTARDGGADGTATKNIGDSEAGEMGGVSNPDEHDAVVGRLSGENVDLSAEGGVPNDGASPPESGMEGGEDEENDESEPA